MIKYLYLLPASVILFWLFSSPPHINPQGAAQQNTTYSCTVDFVPADQHTDQMAGWTATARASVVLPASHRVSGSVIRKSPDKRVADAACRDFFAERARYRLPAEDMALGK